MFIAQIDEVDTFDKNGQQMEDINSLVQYLAQICHIKHKPIKDSDDDNARYFHMEKVNYSITGLQFEIQKSGNQLTQKVIYPPFVEHKLSSIFMDIYSPPPDQA